MAATLFAVNKGFLDDVRRQEGPRFRTRPAPAPEGQPRRAAGKLGNDKAMDKAPRKSSTTPSRRSRSPVRLIPRALPARHGGRQKIAARSNRWRTPSKITKAMEMVAASKMRKAQERMRSARPYATRSATSRPTCRRPTGYRPRLRPAAARKVPRLHRGHDRQGPVRRPEHQHPARRHEPRCATLQAGQGVQAVPSATRAWAS